MALKRSVGRLGAALLLAIGVAGCGQKNGPTAQVSGHVTLDGRPLTSAEIELIPKKSPELGGHSATTDASGDFSIRSPSNSNNPLKPGQYVVLVRKFRSNGNEPGKPGGGMASVVDEVPPVYHDRSKSPLTVDVQEGENTLPSLDLKSGPQRRP